MLPAGPLRLDYAFDAIILMGPPGSGKSHLGSLLHERGIAHFEELEAQLMQRYGGREGFIAHKEEALLWIEQDYARQLASQPLPVAFQATGLSDREILLRLKAMQRTLFARLNTARETCVSRVESRPRGENLSNDPIATASFYDYWQASIAPAWDFSLELSGVDAEADLALIAAALH